MSKAQLILLLQISNGSYPKELTPTVELLASKHMIESKDGTALQLTTKGSMYVRQVEQLLKLQ